MILYFFNQIIYSKFKDFMLDEMHRRKVEKDIADLKKLIGK